MDPVMKGYECLQKKKERCKLKFQDPTGSCDLSICSCSTSSSGSQAKDHISEVGSCNLDLCVCQKKYGDFKRRHVGDTIPEESSSTGSSSSSGCKCKPGSSSSSSRSSEKGDKRKRKSRSNDVNAYMCACKTLNACYCNGKAPPEHICAANLGAVHVCAAEKANTKTGPDKPCGCPMEDKTTTAEVPVPTKTVGCGCTGSSRSSSSKIGVLNEGDTYGPGNLLCPFATAISSGQVSQATAIGPSSPRRCVNDTCDKLSRADTCTCSTRSSGPGGIIEYIEVVPEPDLGLDYMYYLGGPQEFMMEGMGSFGASDLPLDTTKKCLCSRKVSMVTEVGPTPQVIPQNIGIIDVTGGPYTGVIGDQQSKRSACCQCTPRPPSIGTASSIAPSSPSQQSKKSSICCECKSTQASSIGGGQPPPPPPPKPPKPAQPTQTCPPPPPPPPQKPVCQCKSTSMPPPPPPPPVGDFIDTRCTCCPQRPAPQQAAAQQTCPPPQAAAQQTYPDQQPGGITRCTCSSAPDPAGGYPPYQDQRPMSAMPTYQPPCAQLVPPPPCINMPSAPCVATDMPYPPGAGQPIDHRQETLRLLKDMQSEKLASIGLGQPQANDRYNLEQQIRECKCCIAEQENEINRLTGHVESLSKKKGSKRVESKCSCSSSDSEDSTKQQLEELQKELSDIQDKVTKTEKDFADIKTTVTNEKNMVEAMQAECKKIINDKEKDLAITGLTKSLEAVKCENQNLMQLMKTAGEMSDDVKAELTQRLDCLEKQFVMVRTKLKAQEEATCGIRGALKEKDKQIQDLVSSNKKSKCESEKNSCVEALKKALEDAKCENAKLQGMLTKMCPDKGDGGSMNSSNSVVIKKAAEELGRILKQQSDEAHQKITDIVENLQAQLRHTNKTLYNIAKSSGVPVDDSSTNSKSSSNTANLPCGPQDSKQPRRKCSKLQAKEQVQDLLQALCDCKTANGPENVQQVVDL